MYQEHFGLREAPFRITPQTEHFYSGAQRGEVLNALLFALDHDEGIIAISGEVGVGKTMLCRMLIERLPPDARMIYVGNPSLSPVELLQTIAHDLGVTPEENIGLLRQIELRLIQFHAEGLRVIAIIDEAHGMPPASLEQIRLLSNLETGSRKLLQIVLFGQPELDQMLADKAMRSLKDRITQYFRLDPLARKDISEYIDFRLRAVGYRGPRLFGEGAIGMLSNASGGRIRRINILADKTLLAAFAGDTHSITSNHVRTAIQDANFPINPASKRKIAITLIVILLLTLASVLAGYMWQMRSAKDPIALSNTLTPASSSMDAAMPEQSSPQTTQEISRPKVTPADKPSTESRYAPIPAGLSDRAHSLLEHSRAANDATDDKRWFIQLHSLPSATPETVDRYLESLERNGVNAVEIRLYMAKDDPKHHIGVMYGDFESAEAARAALALLPGRMKTDGAFLRQYKSLR